MNKLNELMEEDQSLAINEIDNIKNLSDEVIKLQQLEKNIKAKEQDLKSLKETADKISAEVIPTIMNEMSLSSLKLADGSSVEVKKIYGASIPIAKREAAFNWLRENDLGDIIKNEVTVSFGRGEDNKAADYAVLAQGQGYQPSQKLKVEPMTLKALVRERLEAGQEMPSDLFNVFAGSRTKITRVQ
tara:strand:+ start:408 stop:968 length:561 start_codon:yes stop_codon:yes gene_type:complete